ncbi:DEAD/DEAH box helicase family protein [Leisingera sp. ANG59]|uniref:DEAD/DEAH box helicase family protein n=1 Tax=Leisingera sp. ANG59 TaxID=2675221 RepID=UPI001574DCE0|nr:DEAD/DEAH box helicase family protein [Leisingera sp. ANG59]NSY39291.1 hypothetical protein [Leisingera sp. ANG59]
MTFISQTDTATLQAQSLIPRQLELPLMPAADASAEVVQTSISPNDSCTSSTTSSLSDQILSDLEATLEARGMTTTEPQLEALADVVATLCDMADGSCAPTIHLSSLDPGMGKTTALTHFLRRFVASPDHLHVGVLVCLSRLDEIRRLVDEAGLNEADFAVLCSDKEVVDLSATKADAAQVLFTTQQMLAKRCAGRRMSEIREFRYLGQARAVRVWDETIEPGEVITMSADELAAMLSPLRRISPVLADQVQALQFDLTTSPPGQILQMPALEALFTIAIDEVPATEDFRKRLDKLKAMAGRAARINRTHGNRVIALNIRDALPSDLAPLLVLDASGRVRHTYSAWEAHGYGLARLRSAPKDYAPLQIHLMDQGGGKDGWRRNGDQLAREVATVIDTKPDEPWLVVHHKVQAGVDPVGLIKGYVKKADLSRVSFLHWGAHQATNAFKDVPNVVLAGLLHLPGSQLLGLTYASSGRSVADDPPAGLTEQIEQGELGHGIVQAVGRGSVRGFDAGKCLPCSAYIIAGKRYGLAQALPQWLPGCRLTSWRPRHKPLSGKVRQAVEFVERQRRERHGEPILFSAIMGHIGEKDRSNFNRCIRRHCDFKAANERLGLMEVNIGGGRSYDALQATFGPVDCISA